MHRTRTLGAVVAVAAAGAALAVAPVAGGAATRAQAGPTVLPGAGLARVTLARCHRAGVQADRSAIFRAEMRAIPGSSTMALRIRLLARSRGGSFTPVSAPGIGVWRRSAPGVQGFVYRQRVTNLPAPGDYRAAVRFRWLATDGRVLREVQRVSRTCAHRVDRAALRIEDVRILPANEGSGAYAVTVRNAGRAAAGPFAVALSVAGSRQPLVTVQRLEAGRTVTTRHAGPECPAGRSITVSIDAGDPRDRPRAGDGARTVPCPQPAGAG
jgi:hypothetical protein